MLNEIVPYKVKTSILSSVINSIGIALILWFCMSSISVAVRILVIGGVDFILFAEAIRELSFYEKYLIHSWPLVKRKKFINYHDIFKAEFVTLAFSISNNKFLYVYYLEKGNKRKLGFVLNDLSDPITICFFFIKNNIQISSDDSDFTQLIRQAKTKYSLSK
jgi:hypothetical protein